MTTTRRGRVALSSLALSSSLALLGPGGCYRPPRVVAPVAVAPLTPTSSVPLDSAPKEEPRLVPPEAYMRTYLQLFGGLAPLEVQRRARGGDGNQLFDTWADYLAALGFPDYKLDLPRATETNALMVATFERMGDALCDRAVEHDLKGNPPVAVRDRSVFAFELPPPKDATDATLFAERFDVLHRTFLGYPARLAPTDRTAAFFRLYSATLARHRRADAPKSRLTPAQLAWATVCYGLVRHPEFHFY